eukprot:TRINITY_DN28006_c0_g1_i1.p1 TRINITY_DN28006_c0_g1~~TRINITY_DN28006_c0_g1_i1.p1  ORF type:complete len:234 (-),score=64.94 TRINITY_DN28006_c0_g1_i1:205-906(-)
MVGPNLKAETMSLMETRKSLEKEMDEIIATLTRPGGPGLHGSLLDSEGFPRSDIDIAAVRSSRQRLAMLRNDHKDITEKIDQNLQILFSRGSSRELEVSSSKRTEEESGHQFVSGSGLAGSLPQSLIDVSASQNIPIPMDEDIIVGLPFAVIDEIFEGSPAAMDGLKLGDQILKFGSVNNGENLIPRLSREAQSNQGKEIPVLLLRQGIQMHLTVTPRPWAGQGLLGFHLQML